MVERQAQKLMPVATGKALWKLRWPLSQLQRGMSASPAAALRSRNLSQGGKEETWVLVLPPFWLRYLNRTSNTHFLPRDWKTDELVALQVKKLSFSLGLELDYLERELVYCLNIGTSDYSQVSICNPFSLCLGINLMQSDSLNPKSLSYTSFSKPNSQNSRCWLCINHYWEKSHKPACCHANGVTELVTSVWACFVWLVECHHCAYTLYIRVEGRVF